MTRKISAALAAQGVRLATRDEATRLQTRDAMTYDQQTVDSSGAFLVGELERLDQRLHLPLYNVTWNRDVMLREDVSIEDEVSSFTNSTFASPGGPSAEGKAWIGDNSTAIQGMQLDIGKTAHPLTLWGMQLGWTLPELAKARKLGRPVDQQKYDGMRIKWDMDTDEMVYLGDGSIEATGLLNDPQIEVANATNGGWSVTSDPDMILADIDEILYRIWESSGYTYCPTKLLLPPQKFSILTSAKVSNAGNLSVMNYIKENCISTQQNNTPLDIRPVKWAKGAGTSETDRMMAYTNRQDLVRFPMVPLQRTPIEFRDLRQLTTYYGRLGQLETVYPETLGYADGI